MAYQDRPYYRDHRSSSMNPLMWLLNGSVPLFTVFGIRVRVHASMLLLIALELVLAETKAGLGARNAITAMSILFISVLLHEFGHCFGARMMGGEAHDILMWPLGGLASADPPHRPWPSFVTTAMGPAVNLLLCLLTGSTIALLSHSASAIPWFPFMGNGLLSYVPRDTLTYYLWWVFLVNYALLVFNLALVFYPFDGGRMIQEILWAKVGYYRSMLFATVVGMVVSVIVAAVAVAFWSLMLALIAAFGFYACYKQRQMLREVGAEEWQDSTDYSAAYQSPSAHQTPTKRRRHISRRALRKVRRMAEEALLEQQRIDAILAKVSAHGMVSLTWFERRALHKATERQRKRDLEEVGGGH